jgi:NAD(P)-dependent dehydrogenase (short-subunit alcohol dehydrogenase family)
MRVCYMARSSGSLATDHDPKGVRVVGASAGTIDTPMLAASCAGWSKPKKEIYAEVAKKIPVQRNGWDSRSTWPTRSVSR